MKKSSMITLTALAALGVSAYALAVRPAAETVSVPPADARSNVERGEYLVTIMGCNDCHTPWTMGPQGPEPDMTRMLSGHPQELDPSSSPRLEVPWQWSGNVTNTAFSGPWGISFTANLTPDAETGLGEWTEDTFIRALRTGRHEGQGRPILPPMPYPMYGQATDADLGAIFAFLQSIPPVRNRVPQPVDPPESE